MVVTSPYQRKWDKKKIISFLLFQEEKKTMKMERGTFCLQIKKSFRNFSWRHNRGIFLDLFQVGIYCFMVFIWFQSMGVLFNCLIYLIQLLHNGQLHLDGHNVNAKWSSSSWQRDTGNDSAVLNQSEVPVYQEKRFLGESVELYCNVERKYESAAKFKPEFLWRKDGKEVMPSKRHTVRFTISSDIRDDMHIFAAEGRLHISSLDKDDFGLYMCSLMETVDETCKTTSSCGYSTGRIFNLIALKSGYWKITAPVGASLDIQGLDFITHLPHKDDWRNMEFILQKDGKSVSKICTEATALDIFGGCYASSLFHYALNHHGEIPDVYLDASCPYKYLLPFINYVRLTQKPYTPDYNLQNINNQTQLTSFGSTIRLCVCPDLYGLISVIFRHTNPETGLKHDYLHPVQILLVPPEKDGSDTFQKFIWEELEMNRTSINNTRHNISENLSFVILKEMLMCEWLLRSWTESFALGLVSLTFVITLPLFIYNFLDKIGTIYKSLAMKFFKDQTDKTKTERQQNSPSDKKEIYIAYDKKESLSLVRPLVEILENLGTTVYYHCRDADPRKTLVAMKAKKIEECSKWIILLTKSFLIDRIEPMMILCVADKRACYQKGNVMLIYDSNKEDISECFKDVYESIDTNDVSIDEAILREWLSRESSVMEDFNLIFRPCAVWSALIIAVFQFWLSLSLIVLLVSVGFHLFLILFKVHPTWQSGDCPIIYHYMETFWASWHR